MNRRHFPQTASLKDRLAAVAKTMQEKADLMAPANSGTNCSRGQVATSALSGINDCGSRTAIGAIGKLKTADRARWQGSCEALGRLADHRSSCAKAEHRSTQMKHQRHFDAGDAAAREAVQISKMISDLDRLVRILDCEIAAEEQRAHVFDRSDDAYPVLARMLAARRDNLMDTIAALELRLAGVAVASVPELA
jgi:hypothetical protein